MKKNLLIAAASAALLFTGAASAVMVDSSGAFMDLDPDTVNNITGLGTNRVNWGIAFPSNDPDDPNSGYQFDGVTGEEAPTDGTLFPLGDFTHFNNAIFLPSITSADLDITLDFGTAGMETFPQLVLHDETPNEEPCDPTGATVCPDVITFGPPPSEVVILIDGELLTLDIVGFSTDGGDTITDGFITEEGLENVATLFARLIPPSTTVPEPPTIALMGLALVGFAASKRRSRRR